MRLLIFNDRMRVYGNTDCYNECGTKINVGDKYVSRKGGRSGNKTHIYCLKCGDVKNII